MVNSITVLPSEIIENKILLIRGQKVMMDRDLAILYGVETRVLNQAVIRNKNRFPKDFVFALSKKEYESLRSQSVISKPGRGGRRYLPLVFTEHGVAMLSSVLNSERAIQVNVQIMRTFTKLRELITTHKDLRLQIESLEQKYAKHDHQFKLVFDAIKQLLAEKRVRKSNPIGFIRA